MSWQHIDGIGLVHFQDVKPARVVPGPERHKWANKHLAWGESTHCEKCGCAKHRLKTQPFYTERYQMPGALDSQEERPACTGSKAPTPPQSQLLL